MRRLSSLARRPCREDSGFTLIELMVAMFVILVIMTASLGVFFSSLSTIAEGKQRQSATAVGNRLMEELRALPYDTIRAGLYSGDLTGDPNVSGSNFRPAYNSSINEVLQTTTNASQVAPLNPHKTTTVLNKTTFTSSVYVTQALAGTQAQYNLTVIVSWKSAATHGATKTQALRTTEFSPSGCLSTATHPFSGPCQAYYYSTAGSGPGGVLIQAATPAAPAFSTLPNLTTMDATLPTVSSETQIEQIATLTAKAVTSGVQQTDIGGVTSAGSVSGIASADTDPSTASPTSASQSTPAQSTGPLTESALGDSVTIQNSGGDSGSATSAIAAAASPACTDVSTAVAFTTGQPCTSAALTPAGSALTGVWNPNGTLNALGTTTLFSVAAAPSALKTFSTRFISPNGTYCPSVTGTGCSASAAVRSLGNVTVGGLPTMAPNEAALAPAQFSGFAKITGYTDKAVATAAASGAAAPTATATGTLSYWNGTSYTSISLAGPHVAVTAAPVIATYNVGGGNVVRITEAGSITFPGFSTVTTGVTPCTSACTVTATSSPPSVTVRYTIVVRSPAGVDTQIADFNVIANLGLLEAKSTYKAAPVG